MIKKIRLKNWKSYEDSILYLDPLTILTGMNASGKSNVIDALIFINRIAGGISIFEAISGNTSLNALRGGIGWVCKKNTNAFTRSPNKKTSRKYLNTLYPLFFYSRTVLLYEIHNYFYW